MSEQSARPEGERKAQVGTSPVAAAAASTGAAAAHGGKVAQEGMHQLADTMRKGGEMGEELTRAGTEAGAEAARRTLDVFADGQRQFVEQAAEQFEIIARRMETALRDSAYDLRSFLLTPTVATDGLREMQTGMTELVNGVVRSNVQTARRLLRMADPGVMIDLQRQAMREQFDAWIKGTSSYMRAVRHATEQTLRPIEMQADRRRRQHHAGNGHEGEQFRVSDVMRSDVRIVTPEDTVQQATRVMREEDTGVLPVGEGDRLVGVVTDHDIAVRLVADGRDPSRTKVRELMTDDAKYVFEDEDIEGAAQNMTEQQVSRVPVVNRKKRVVGIVSLDDLTRGGYGGQHAARPVRAASAETGSAMPNAAE